MELMKKLESEYGYNTPILLKELKVDGMTDAGIRQTLTRLVQMQRLERYARGVYYIAENTPHGKSVLSAKKVYERKYICNEKEVYGYYSGLVLENAVGLSTQIPNIIEIVTNNERSRIREINVGSQKVRLRRSKVEVHAKNVKVLQFLELMNREEWMALSEEKKKKIINYVKEINIERESVYKYIAYYPSRVAKNILGSGIADQFI